MNFFLTEKNVYTMWVAVQSLLSGNTCNFTRVVTHGRSFATWATYLGWRVRDGRCLLKFPLHRKYMYIVFTLASHVLETLASHANIRK